MTEPHSTEIWCPVVGYEHLYSVSDCGSVRRDAAGQGTRAGRRVKTGITAKGYVRAPLSLGDRRLRHHMVHRLVAAAFIGPCPDGCEVNHKNTVKTDNRPENLEYITHGDNIRHAFSNGLVSRAKGSRNHAAKLTEADVVVIRAELAKGVGLGTLGKRYGVSKQVIFSIRNRTTWRHI